MGDDEDFPWAEWKRAEARAFSAASALAERDAAIDVLVAGLKQHPCPNANDAANQPCWFCRALANLPEATKRRLALNEAARKVVEAARIVTPGPWAHDISKKAELRDALAAYDALLKGEP
jgi:hypothetical protein